MGFLHFIIILLVVASPFHLAAQSPEVNLTIHLRGVFESKISLLGLSNTGTWKSILEVQGIKNQESAILRIDSAYLPGEFVLRFDYKEKETSIPYPSEKYLFISDQNLELWVSPMYCNNPDSTLFQDGEKENSTFSAFLTENSRRIESTGLLQQFLMNYDDTESKFYQEGIVEYEKRRKSYNAWLTNEVHTDRDMFVSSVYLFNYIPEVTWEGTEQDRLISLREHYFDGIDLDDPLIVKTSRMNDWMNAYVNLHGQMATTVALRDSLIPAAAKTAIEKARSGDPTVYGWMVDYFYRGFEANNIPAGMKVLEPYMNDPACLTSKRLEIERRLKGMETLIAGSIAPDFAIDDSSGRPSTFHHYYTGDGYKLVLFWSAGCEHCTELVHELYQWSMKPEIQSKLCVFAVSLDETETEILNWKSFKSRLPGWQHILAPAGVNSPVASDYYILATPVMILVNSRTNEIVAIPETLDQLKNELR
jgi:hypothetical protein